MPTAAERMPAISGSLESPLVKNPVLKAFLISPAARISSTRVTSRGLSRLALPLTCWSTSALARTQSFSVLPMSCGFSRRCMGRMRVTPRLTRGAIFSSMAERGLS